MEEQDVSAGGMTNFSTVNFPRARFSAAEFPTTVAPTNVAERRLPLFLAAPLIGWLALGLWLGIWRAVRFVLGT